MIYLLFAVLFILMMTPLIVIDVVRPLAYGRYVGLVEGAIVQLGGIAAVILGFDFILKARQQQSMRRVARVGVQEVAPFINRTSMLFAFIVKASSLKFSPKSYNELFGEHTAELLSVHLALDSMAGTLPPMPWRQYLAREATAVKDQISSSIARYQVAFSETILIALSSIVQNPLFLVLGHLNIPIDDGIDRPTLNAPVETLASFLGELGEAIELMAREADRLQSQVKVVFPTGKIERDDIGPGRGSARYEGKLGPPLWIGLSSEFPR